MHVEVHYGLFLKCAYVRQKVGSETLSPFPLPSSKLKRLPWCKPRDGRMPACNPAGGRAGDPMAVSAMLMPLAPGICCTEICQATGQSQQHQAGVIREVLFLSGDSQWLSSTSAPETGSSSSSASDAHSTVGLFDPISHKNRADFRADSAESDGKMVLAVERPVREARGMSQVKRRFKAT